MSSRPWQTEDGLVIAGPVARELLDVLELAGQALERVPMQPWGEFDGPALPSIIARVHHVLNVQAEFQKQLETTG